jgi:hypothetical protein
MIGKNKFLFQTLKVQIQKIRMLRKHGADKVERGEGAK